MIAGSVENPAAPVGDLLRSSQGPAGEGDVLGVYSEYLDANMDFPALTAERKTQLHRLSEARGGRDVLVYAAHLMKSRAPISIVYEDLLPIRDQLDNLSGTAIDVILETPGGAGEVAEDIVRLLRGKYEHIAVIVPGWAKSAGTIIAMGADEIVMGPGSALGPIDAQLSWQGKSFSADALLEGINKIKTEVNNTGSLNKAYIPILQGISPGELQSAENALDFARQLVTDWLATYKFKDWNVHSSTGQGVTDEEKRQRAEEVASKLCDHQFWKTHGRSINLDDFETMRLKVTDYSDDPALSDAIKRYHTLLQMTFSSAIYKVVETPTSQIYRSETPQAPPQQPGGLAQPNPADADVANVQAQCPACQLQVVVQANIETPKPLQPGHLPFPASGVLKCPRCEADIDLKPARQQIEQQLGRSIIPQEAGDAND